MNIIEESFKEKQEKPKKRRKMLLIFIIILVIAIISIIVTLIVIRRPDRTAYIDGQLNNDIVGLLKEVDEKSYSPVTNEQSSKSQNKNVNTTFFIPIKRVAQYVGYTAYDGDYTTKSEEESKCYIENDNEVVTLSLNLKRIYRIGKSQENDNYEYYDMKTPVKSFNGELCIQVDEMKEVFNATLTYDQQKNIINIETLNYLLQKYASTVRDSGFEMIDEDFDNQKAILKDMIVVTNKDEKIYAVIKASTGETVIEPKYSGITYLPTVGDFIVEDNEKFGVISPKRENKVAVNYDEIDLIDKDAGLYLVKKDDKYGVVDLKGASKISVEFDEIGIDTTKFKENNIKNKYLIVDNLIPVKKGELWGLYDKKGNMVVNIEYDSFGYIASNNKNAMNLLVVPDYNVIVACKNKKYALINKSGEPLFAPVVDDIYMTYEGGKYNYIMNYNDSTMNVEDYLKQVDTTQRRQENQATEQPHEQEIQQSENQGEQQEQQ